MAPTRGDLDRILSKLAADLMARGLRCCGTVQINRSRLGVKDTYGGVGPCDMDVRVLPDGPVLRISQNLGPSARGCRLDLGALETAVGLVAADLNKGADLMIINKFGKHEAQGRGFRDVIAQSLALDIPVLLGLRPINRDAFETFAAGTAIELPPDPAAVRAWVDRVTAAKVEPL
ncbi:DUF2478 domain-containing protein [Iodidimonas nitroreducens]|uniref:DUF2478 domain-containing protein n=1 Tax=Iodidimonas nitroreducens TaxID=1236968 RepID=UPI0028D1031D|nr:DUF2478 domain-containing protein [Iodidimonas nitroreducens]